MPGGQCANRADRLLHQPQFLELQRHQRPRQGADLCRPSVVRAGFGCGVFHHVRGGRCRDATLHPDRMVGRARPFHRRLRDRADQSVVGDRSDLRPIPGQHVDVDRRDLSGQRNLDQHLFHQVTPEGMPMPIETPEAPKLSIETLYAMLPAFIAQRRNPADRTAFRSERPRVAAKPCEPRLVLPGLRARPCRRRVRRRSPESKTLRLGGTSLQPKEKSSRPRSQPAGAQRSPGST